MHLFLEKFDLLNPSLHPHIRGGPLNLYHLIDLLFGGTPFTTTGFVLITGRGFWSQIQEKV
jgi:hypothetical protein